MTSTALKDVSKDYRSLRSRFSKVCNFLAKLVLTTSSSRLKPELLTDNWKQPSGLKKIEIGAILPDLVIYIVIFKPQKSQKVTVIKTWKLWDSCLMSHVVAVCSFPNHGSTSMRPSVISGPYKSCMFLQTHLRKMPCSWTLYYLVCFVRVLDEKMWKIPDLSSVGSLLLW